MIDRGRRLNNEIHKYGRNFRSNYQVLIETNYELPVAKLTWDFPGNIRRQDGSGIVRRQPQ